MKRLNPDDSQKGADKMTQTDDITRTVHEYGNTLYRICFLMLKNHADAEDAVQESFIKYMQKAPVFTSNEHKKAWLITVSANKCRDMLRRRIHTADESEEILSKITVDKESSGIMEALFELPEKFRIVMTLHYVEGYKVGDIAEIIGKSSSAVKMRLQKGRTLLRDLYEKEYML